MGVRPLGDPLEWVPVMSVQPLPEPTLPASPYPGRMSGVPVEIDLGTRGPDPITEPASMSRADLRAEIRRLRRQRRSGRPLVRPAFLWALVASCGVAAGFGAGVVASM